MRSSQVLDKRQELHEQAVKEYHKHAVPGIHVR